MKKAPPLSIVEPGSTGVQPPRPLAAAGRSLWTRVQHDYDVSDVAGVEMLAIACEATDRIATLRAEIDRDGEVIRTRNGGVKAHPALRDELSNRAFVVRTLSKLGLNFEPLKAAPGRPPVSTSWRGHDQ